MKGFDNLFKVSFSLNKMIIGLTGPICSGVDTFAEILKKERGFLWFSYSDILREEARDREIELTRVSLQDLGDELRKNEGLGVLSKRIAKKIKERPEENYVVGNIRNPGEVHEMRKIFGDRFVLVKLDAPSEIRFQRLFNRRREKDPQNFPDFVKMEERDLGKKEAEHGQQHAAVFALADVEIDNSQALHDLREKALKLVDGLNTNS